MSEMSPELLEQMRVLAEEYIQPHGGTLDACLGSGGSAAVFKWRRGDAVLALKVYDPTFFDEEDGPAERQRIELQAALIGHECPQLVGIESVEFAFGTCFMCMQFVPGKELSKCLAEVPRDKIWSLIGQLSDALIFLDKRNLVHRDIKPHNIMVSEDFSTLTLIDLGVVRETNTAGDYAGTDHGRRRPFIATAQYSSPEYLFRLVEPSPDFWRGLTFYQVGGVLHDLIMRRALFQDEVSSANRYIVAMAVLRKTPALNPDDIVETSLRALAARCLTKDLSQRLKLVTWADFRPNSTSAADRLQQRLQKLSVAYAGPAEIELEKNRLRMTRQQCVSQLLTETRSQVKEQFEEVYCERVSNDVPDSAGLLTIRVPQVGIFVDISIQVNWPEDPTPLQGLVTVHAFARTETTVAAFHAPKNTICALDAESMDLSLPIFNLRDFIANAVLNALDIGDSGQLNEHGCSLTF
ncbi:protein kinase [Massilia sp. NP310]|uniref:serine/threonine protein kinase n=1 Tax=Massilia sp. NP310 TaxID=2861282 RepID=UPI001C63A602|nr:protein kinase [Massilia sp. NP310]QYG02510.1 protein kinase [Massilia sp. NP310]